LIDTHVTVHVQTETIWVILYIELLKKHLFGEKRRLKTFYKC